MDRLSIALAISRGRRLYHGQPFAVFALDLRDPLGACVARLLHGLGDARSVEELRRRAELRERAPIAVVCSSMKHVRKLPSRIDRAPGLAAKEGCTPGDMDALRAFVRGARALADGVAVFLAADLERTVFRFPLDRRALPQVLQPIDPLLFGPLLDGSPENDIEEQDDPENDHRDGGEDDEDSRDAHEDFDSFWEPKADAPAQRAESPEGAAVRRRLRDAAARGFTHLAIHAGIGWIDAVHRVERAVFSREIGAADLWVPARIACCSEDDILDGLAALGIETDRDAFLAATASDTSAFPHAIHPWLRSLPEDGPPRDTDFVVLAGIDLWKRWRPERPCREALLLRWMDGNHAVERGDVEEALRAWLDFGDLVWKAAPKARAPSDIDRILKRPPGSAGDPDDDEDQDEDWPGSFEDFLADITDRSRELLEDGIVSDTAEAVLVRVTAYFREIEARLPDADRDLLWQNAVDSADLLDHLGRRAELRDLARATIAKSPKNAAGYVWLARSLAFDPTAATADLEEGQLLVRRAVLRVKNGHEEFGLAGDLYGAVEDLADRIARRGAWTKEPAGG